jgi:hypothetical protein
MPRYRITINSKDRAAMLDLIRQHKIDVFDHGVTHTESGGYTVHALADQADIQKLENLGYHVERHEDVDAQAKSRQAEVGRGDRYAKPRQDDPPAAT